jgi:hypothetical protein
LRPKNNSLGVINTADQTIFMRIRMFQAGDEEVSHIWKPQLGDDEEGSGKDGRRVKRALDMLVVETWKVR